MVAVFALIDVTAAVRCHGDSYCTVPRTLTSYKHTFQVRDCISEEEKKLHWEAAAAASSRPSGRMLVLRKERLWRQTFCAGHQVAGCETKATTFPVCSSKGAEQVGHRAVSVSGTLKSFT